MSESKKEVTTSVDTGSLDPSCSCVIILSMRGSRFWGPLYLCMELQSLFAHYWFMYNRGGGRGRVGIRDSWVLWWEYIGSGHLVGALQRDHVGGISRDSHKFSIRSMRG